MEWVIDNQTYKVEIQRKNNKNTYLRVNEDLTILITTNYLVSKKQISDLLRRNEKYLQKMISKRIKEQEKKKLFSYLGKNYDIVIVPTMNKIEIINNKILVKSWDYLNKWYGNEIKRVFSERLNIIYQKFNEQLPYPKLKIRKMKTRWGVCNRKNLSITLNSELIKLDIEKIDYVIIHELAHFIHFNHSINFWNIVAKYCPNYKAIRKSMKE
ncbi:MAG: M48 family metallopeptidase [Mollicutes bacterium]|nr:M48 family metallopeptidase [Mollicutes bacterium]